MVTSTRSLSPRPLAIRCRRSRRLPQPRQLLRQGMDLVALASRQTRGLVAAEPGVFLLETTLLLQSLLPAPLQFPHHQAVLRFDRVVLPLRPLGLIAGALQLLLPVPVQPRAFLLDIVGRRQVQL